MEKKFDVIALGGAVVDLPLGPLTREVFDCESYPVDGIAMTIGGDAINEATIITRLGKKVSLVSCSGMDVPGGYIQDHCIRNGIDTTWFVMDPDLDTSINVGLVTPDGERTFITNRQGSLWKFSPDMLDLSCLEQGRLLSFASFFNNPLLTGAFMEEVFARAKKNGMVICADMIKPRLGETLEDIRGALSMVDYFFPNYDEASLMTGETDVDAIADIFLACGVKNVIVKVGKKGALAKSATERGLIPGYPHSKLVDTIGAGDNFASGFITAVLEGRSLMDCARFANAVASISVEAAGAVGALKDRRQADERYEAYLQATGQA